MKEFNIKTKEVEPITEEKLFYLFSNGFISEETYRKELLKLKELKDGRRI